MGSSDADSYIGLQESCRVESVRRVIEVLVSQRGERGVGRADRGEVREMCVCIGLDHDTVCAI